MPIIIIGARILGIAACRALHKAGMKSIVLEAKDGVGECMSSSKMRGVVVDWGGALLHRLESLFGAYVQEHHSNSTVSWRYPLYPSTGIGNGSPVNNNWRNAGGIGIQIWILLRRRN
jgi:predicted NAD/FAD-dependent oxidoreductase